MAEDLWDVARTSALSGSGAGAAAGGLGALLGGSRSIPAILRAALAGGIGGGALTGGSAVLGSALRGAPRADEPAPYTTRGAIGGATLGTGAGGGLGALLASGYLLRNPAAASWLKRLAPIGTDHLIGDLYRHLATNPSLAKTLLGSAGGALAGGVGGGYLGASEGMGVDALDQNLR